MARMKAARVYGVILAGGKSSRLFPFNKVLSDLTGSGKSLIQNASHRLGKMDIYVLTVQEMVKPIRNQLKLPNHKFFVDPVRRGTWPAILWAMAHLRWKDPAGVMAIVTADHAIQGDRAFRRNLQQAVAIAQSEPAIVMMGIPPRDDPQEWRGFGCFRANAEGRVTVFFEKPPVERAYELVRQGGWSWNSGMFFFQISAAETALRLLQPEMHRVYSAMIAAIEAGKEEEAAFLYHDFPDKIPHPLDPAHYVDNSMDYAIMTPLVARANFEIGAYAVRSSGFQWTDLGQWDALRQVLKADRSGNIRVGKTILKGHVRNTILVAEKGCTIEVHDAEDLIIAFGLHAALILKAAALPRVKEAAQEALKHLDRVVMEHDVTNCEIQASGGRVVAIGLDGLSIQLKGRRLAVSTKKV